MAQKTTDKLDKLHSEKNFSRDPYTFRPPTKKDTETGKIRRELQKNVANHRNEHYPSAVVYHWTKDKQTVRNFVIPRELAADLDNLNFARDVLAALTTLYMENPEASSVETTFSELCKIIGVAANGENYDRIQTALTILRAYTIQHQKIPLEVRQNLTVNKWGTVTFGFVDSVVTVTDIGKDLDHLRPIPLQKRTITITLSPHYRKLLAMTGTCIIPRSALDKARTLPIAQVIAAKNLIYYLSARSGVKAELFIETIAEIMNIHTRWPGETQKTVESILENMAKKELINYEKDGQNPSKIKLKLIYKD